MVCTRSAGQSVCVCVWGDSLPLSLLPALNLANLNPINKCHLQDTQVATPTPTSLSNAHPLSRGTQLTSCMVGSPLTEKQQGEPGPSPVPPCHVTWPYVESLLQTEKLRPLLQGGSVFSRV